MPQDARRPRPSNHYLLSKTALYMLHRQNLANAPMAVILAPVHQIVLAFRRYHGSSRAGFQCTEWTLSPEFRLDFGLPVDFGLVSPDVAVGLRVTVGSILGGE